MTCFDNGKESGRMKHGLSKDANKDVQRIVERSGLKGRQKQAAYKVVKAQVAAIERVLANPASVPKPPPKF